MSRTQEVVDGVLIEYPESVPIVNGIVQFEVIIVFPKPIDTALVEVKGLGEFFREVIHGSDTSIIFVEFINPPSGVQGLELNIYRGDSIVFSHRFKVEFVDDPLGVVYVVARREGSGYKVAMEVEVKKPGIELVIEAYFYGDSEYLDEVLREEVLYDVGVYRVDLGVFDLERYLLELNLVYGYGDLEWRRIIVLPSISIEKRL